MIKKKAALTLVEMMLVLGLISIIAGLVALNVRGLLHEQRFRTEVTLVLDTLRVAQDLMLIANSDAHVVFSKDPRTGFISYRIELEKPLTKGWTREVTRPRPPLTAVRTIEFQDSGSGVKAFDNFALSFLSGGTVMSSGNLRLADADRNATLQSLICLPGYPAPLGGMDCTKDPKVRDFREKLTHNTQQAIQEKDLAHAPQ